MRNLVFHFLPIPHNNTTFIHLHLCIFKSQTSIYIIRLASIPLITPVSLNCYVLIICMGLELAVLLAWHATFPSWALSPVTCMMLKIALTALVVSHCTPSYSLLLPLFSWLSRVFCLFTLIGVIFLWYFFKSNFFYLKFSFAYFHYGL